MTVGVAPHIVTFAALLSSIVRVAVLVVLRLQIFDLEGQGLFCKYIHRNSKQRTSLARNRETACNRQHSTTDNSDPAAQTN